MKGAPGRLDLAGRLANGAAVYVDYTPSPEAHFPVAINQAYEATKWVAGHGQEIGVDGSRLGLVGNSVGGNMVASVALLAKQFNGPKIRYNVMLWPVTDANFDTASYNQFENGYFLSKNMMKWFWDNYTPSAADRNNILASPLRASTAQLKGFPETLIQTAELDVLRDEGEAFGRKLDAARRETEHARERDRERRLAEARRAVQQHVVERLAALFRRRDKDGEVSLCLFLTNVFLKRFRAQRALLRVLAQESLGHDRLFINIGSKINAQNVTSFHQASQSLRRARRKLNSIVICRDRR